MLVKSVNFQDIKVPKVLVFYSREVLKDVASYVYNQVYNYFLKRDEVLLCPVCLGVGYLYKGKSILAHIIDIATNYVGEQILSGFDNRNTTKIETILNKAISDLLSIYAQLKERVAKNEEVELKLTGFTKCPECHATGTYMLFLEDFGKLISSNFFKSSLLEAIKKNDVYELIKYYKSRPIWKRRKYRKNFGNFKIKREWQSKYLSDLAREVVGDFTITNSFAGLIKRFARVKTGALKSGLYKKEIQKGHGRSEFLISTTAKAKSTNYPQGFLYASLYDNFSNVGKRTWSRVGITTTQLFQRVLNRTERKYNLNELHTINSQVVRFIRLFDWNSK